MKKYIPFTIALFFMMALVSSCHEELDPTDDLFEPIGSVAQITTFTASPSPVDANGTVTLTVKCHAVDTEMKELKFYQRIGTSGSYVLSSTVPFAANFSEAERLHVLTIPYTVPNEKGKTFSIQVEIVTTNDLVSNRRTVSPTNISIR